MNKWETLETKQKFRDLYCKLNKFETFISGSNYSFWGSKSGSNYSTTGIREIASEYSVYEDVVFTKIKGLFLQFLDTTSF